MNSPVDVTVKCPVCGKKAKSTFSVYYIPRFGEALLTSISCDNCGYKSSDVIIAREDNPKRFELKVDSEEKLNCRVIRSSHGDIILPEFGIEIRSTGFSEGFITNIDGLLLRIEDVLKEKVMNKENAEKVEELIERLEKAREGKEVFRVIIEDKTGNSAILKNR